MPIMLVDFSGGQDNCWALLLVTQNMRKLKAILRGLMLMQRIRDFGLLLWSGGLYKARWHKGIAKLSIQGVA